MMDIRKFAVLLSLLSLSAIVGCGEQTAVSPRDNLPPVTVQVETLALTRVPFQIEVAGTVQAVDQAEIAARISGAVIEVPVQPGARVAKGALLVRIDAAEISAQVRRAKTQRDQAQRNLDRETKLLQLNATTSETVNTLQETLLMADAGYREARAMLAYTEIRAPFSGTITHKLIEVGDLAVPGITLLKMEIATVLEIVAQIPEAMTQHLATGDRLPVSVPASELSSMGVVSEIAPTVEPLSRTTRIKLSLPQNKGLRSGQFARVALSGNGEATLLIAKSALHHQGQMEQVFVVDQGLARLRLVRVGSVYGERIEILTGLRAGEQVVVSAEDRLQDGQPLVIAAGQPR